MMFFVLSTKLRANPTISTLKKWKAKYPHCVFHPDLRAGGSRKPHPFNCEDVLEEARCNSRKAKKSMKSSQSSSSSSIRSNSSSEIKSIIETQAKVATLVEYQTKIASMMENILANQKRTGTSESPPIEPPDNIEDKTTATSSHSIDEVSFAAGTVDASISIISNNTNIKNHYIQSSPVPPLQSCLRQSSQKSDKHVSFHDSTSFQRPITSSIRHLCLTIPCGHS